MSGPSEPHPDDFLSQTQESGEILKMISCGVGITIKEILEDFDLVVAESRFCSLGYINVLVIAGRVNHPVVVLVIIIIMSLDFDEAFSSIQNITDTALQVFVVGFFIEGKSFHDKF